MLDIVKVLHLYKKDEITTYSLEKELARILDQDAIVKIIDGKNAIPTSFIVFLLPVKKIEGFRIHYFIDKDAIMNLYSAEDFADVLIKLSGYKQVILNYYNRFLLSYKDSIVSYSTALGFSLGLYMEYLKKIISIDGSNEFAPDINTLADVIEKLKNGEELESTIETLVMKEYIAPEILDTIKSEYVTLRVEANSQPIGLQHADLKNYAVDSYAEYNHKEIKPDYLPSTNQ